MQIARGRWMWKPLVAIIMLGFSAPPVAAAPGMAVIDASNVFAIGAGITWQSIRYLSPLGQEFRPALPALDSVEVYTEDEARGNGQGAKLRLNVRENTIEGPIVGRSSPVTLPDGFSGVTHFRFRSLISLSPRKRYVIELVVLSGDNWSSVMKSVNSYSGGRAIVLGQPQPYDRWFREGLAHSTLLTRAYCKNGLWKHLFRANGRRFKNERDCIRYVNTGK